MATKSQPTQFVIAFGLAKYILRSLLRNRNSFFFGLIFPVVIVSVFGSFGSGASKTKIGLDPAIDTKNPVVISLQSVADSEDAPLTLDKSPVSDLEAKLGKNDIDGVLELNGDKLLLKTSNTNPQGSATAHAFVGSVVDKVNLAAAAAAHVPPVISIDTQEVSGKTLRAIDFILPGQIGFSLLSVAIFGVAFSFLSLRKTLVLKRIFATSVKPLTFVMSQVLARSVQGILQALVLIVFGVVAFKFTLANGAITLVEIMVMATLGILTFIGFGIFFANIAPDEQSLPVYLNLFNLPQLFLSGIFFSNDLLPTWLSKIGNNLPLAYLANALRKITLEGASLIDVLPYIGGMAIWAVISYIISARTFKTE